MTNQPRLYKDKQLVLFREGTGKPAGLYRVQNAKNVNGFWSYALEHITDSACNCFSRQDDIMPSYFSREGE